jgi:MoxR-like ATPase
VHIDPSLKQYMVDIVAATREHSSLVLGASPRASIGLMRTGQSRAALQGREYVLPDDVKALAAPVLCHRLIPKPEARIRPDEVVSVVSEILDQMPVPAV